MRPPWGWLSYLRERGRANVWHSLPASSDPMSATLRVQRPDLKFAGQHVYKGGEMNRGIIGVIIGVLVIIILVIVILQLT